MLTDSTSSDVFGGHWQSIDLAPHGAAWVVFQTPEYPPLADSDADTIQWRDYRIDRTIGGLAPFRASPTRLDIGHIETCGTWQLPVSVALSTRVAWHPERTLVAGLARQDRQTVVWVADYAARTVRVLDGIAVVTSLTGMDPSGGQALSWCDGVRLVVLVSAASRMDDQSTGSVSPVVYEASGPGRIAFLPGLAELAMIAGARPTIVDLQTGTVTPLTAPGVVRSVQPSPSGRYALIEIAKCDDLATADGIRWVQIMVALVDPGNARDVPVGSRWALDADILVAPEPLGDGRQRLHWLGVDDTWHRVRTMSALKSEKWWPMWRGGEPIAVTAGRDGIMLLTEAGPTTLAWPPGAAGSAGLSVRSGTSGFRSCLLLTCFDNAGRAGAALVDPRRPAVTVAWAPDDRRVRDAWTFYRNGTPEILVRSAMGISRYQLSGDRVTASSITSPCLIPTTTPTLEYWRRVAVHTGPAIASLTTLSSDNDPTAAWLLWLRVTGTDQQSPGPATDKPTIPVLAAAAGKAAVLDLPLDWPPDAPLEYLHMQIVQAATRAIAELGSDPVVLAGHSFAATVALYAMAHVSNVAGAIAHSGCYNRTRTLHGFQFEKRTYWQAPDIYQAFSALHFADKLDRPVLIIHGTEDDNPSTPADQAVELYRAVVAAGGHARLVLLPREGHNLRHAESLRTALDEQRRWLARSVKAVR